MLQPISLPKSPPRSLDEIQSKIVLKKGLTWYTLLGYFFTIGPLLSLVSMYITNEPGRQSIGIGILGYLIGPAVGILLIRYAQKVYHHRKQAMIEGESVQAVVLEKGRKFNPFSSTQRYSLTVNLADSSEKKVLHTIVSSHRDLHGAYEVGDSLEGFRHPQTNRLFFPAQLGYELTIN